MLVAALLFGGCFAAVLILFLRAPEGYEDERGFHLGPDTSVPTSLARAVHRNACNPLSGVPVGLLQPLDHFSDKHTDTLAASGAGGGLTFHDHSNSAEAQHDHA